MRHFALASSLSLIVAACSAGTEPSAPTSSAAAPAPSVRTTSPAPSTPTPVPTLSMSARISMGDNFFTPDDVTVAVGATVTWEIISGDARHDVVAGDGSFRSNSPMNRGDLFSYTFTKAGEYPYICTFHTIEGMVGKIVVK